jgi:Flp pilus assembly protein TadD
MDKQERQSLKAAKPPRGTVTSIGVATSPSPFESLHPCDTALDTTDLLDGTQESPLCQPGSKVARNAAWELHHLWTWNPTFRGEPPTVMIDGLARALTLAWIYEHPTQALESQIRGLPEAAMSGDVEMPPTTQDKDSETSVGGDLTRWVPWLEAQARRDGGWSREELAALDLMAVLLEPGLWSLPAAEAHQRWERLRVAIDQFGVERVPRREEVADRCDDFGDVLDPDVDVPCQYGVESVEAYQMSIRLGRSGAPLMYKLGLGLEVRLGRYADAEAAYRKALELDPMDAYPHNGLGNLLQHRLGRYEEAEAAYRKAMELDPKDAYPHRGLGNLLQYRLGRYEEAEAAYRKAMELDPKYARPHNALCLLYQFHLGRLREAREVVERAIQLAPDNSDCRETQGLYLEESGDLDGAERAFRQGLRCRPGELENTVGIGWVALQSRNDITAAREALASLSVSDRARPSATLLEAGLVVWEGRWAEAQPLLARWIRDLPATLSWYPWTQRSRWCALMRRSGVPVPWLDWHRLFTEASGPASWTEWITAIEALRDGRPAAELSDRRSRWIYSCISVGPTFCI